MLKAPPHVFEALTRLTRTGDGKLLTEFLAESAQNALLKLKDVPTEQVAKMQGRAQEASDVSGLLQDAQRFKE